MSRVYPTANLFGMVVPGLISTHDLQAIAGYRKKLQLRREPEPHYIDLRTIKALGLDHTYWPIGASYLGIIHALRCAYCNNWEPTDRDRCRTCAGDLSWQPLRSSTARRATVTSTPSTTVPTVRCTSMTMCPTTSPSTCGTSSSRPRLLQKLKAWLS